MILCEAAEVLCMVRQGETLWIRCSVVQARPGEALESCLNDVVSCRSGVWQDKLRHCGDTVYLRPGLHGVW